MSGLLMKFGWPAVALALTWIIKQKIGFGRLQEISSKALHGIEYAEANLEKLHALAKELDEAYKDSKIDPAEAERIGKAIFELMETLRNRTVLSDAQQALITAGVRMPKEASKE